MQLINDKRKAAEEIDASEQHSITQDWKETPPLNDFRTGRVQWCEPVRVCFKSKTHCCVGFNRNP